MTKKVISAAEICENYLGRASRTTFYRFRQKNHDFPPKVPYSGGLLFRADAVEEWFQRSTGDVERSTA